MRQILIFGDSITYGAWDKEGGWVQRLRKFLDEKNLMYPDFYCLVYNLGISGNNSEDLLKRFEFETKQRLKEDEETIIIFAIGINDSQFVYSENKHRVPVDKFKENIQKLIQLAQKYSSKIIFVGLTPVDETKTTPIPWNTDISYKNKYIQKYNETIKTICRKNKTYFIEIFEKLKELNYQELLDDGLHLNSSGHKKIFEIIKDFLNANVINAIKNKEIEKGKSIKIVTPNKVI
jgi:lysophospholipase L1-like esterase